MRTPLAAAVCLSLAACGGAQEKPKPVDEKKDKAELSVGDAAPPLAITKWVAGATVAKFEPGKVYVVEFWATWCGPCIAAMPHLAGLQADYKDQGLVVLGVTSKDPNNTQDKVEKFVEKRGKKLGYAFGYCDGDAMDRAYMEASGQQGIPCSFVVDKGGRLAFIGHPMQLDDVLPKVLAGTWKGEADVRALVAAEKAADDEMKKVMAGFESDPAGTIDGLTAFAKKYPSQAKQDMFKVRLVAAQMKAKKFDDAKAATEGHIKFGAERGQSGLLGYVASVWTDKSLNPDKKNYDLVEKAVEAILKNDGEDDLTALMTAAEVYQAMGQSDKAVSYVDKAIKATDDARMKSRLEEAKEKYKKK